MEDLCEKGEEGKHRRGRGKGQAVLHIFSIGQPSKSTIIQAIGVGPALQMEQQQQPLFSWDLSADGANTLAGFAAEGVVVGLFFILIFHHSFGNAAFGSNRWISSDRASEISQIPLLDFIRAASE